MTLGNLPKDRGAALEGKTYWRLAIGTHAVAHRYFDGGWRAFEFIVFKPYHDPYDQGAALPYRFRIAFAYWLPIYPL